MAPEDTWNFQDHKENQSFNSRADQRTTTTPKQIVNSRIMKYFGNVSRTEPDNKEKLMVHGKVEGLRQRGRSPKICSDHIKTATNLGIFQTSRATEAATTYGGES